MYHYCIARADLPIGALAAQLIHAAGESAKLGDLPEHTHAVALSVPDEQTLLLLEAKLIDANIPHKAIREPDEPFNGQLVAIGLQPQLRTRDLRRLLGAFSLIK